LFALALHHFPARLDRHHLPRANRSPMRRLVRARFRFFLSRRRFRERPKNHFRVTHAALHAIDGGPDAVASLSRQVLRDAEFLVAEHARQELSAPAGTHRRHHAQLLLPREIRVEEFRHRHAEPALHELRDGGDRICDGSIGAIEVNLRARQSADDAIAMGAKLEIELDLHLSARPGPHEPDGVPVAANSRIPVERPRDRFENRGLAGAVRTDDAGESSPELELRPYVLTEVGELETIESHAMASSSAGPATRSASRR
jgi:hypothetical protein